MVIFKNFEHCAKYHESAASVQNNLYQTYLLKQYCWIPVGKALSKLLICKCFVRQWKTLLSSSLGSTLVDVCGDAALLHRKFKAFLDLDKLFKSLRSRILQYIALQF